MWESGRKLRSRRLCRLCRLCQRFSKQVLLYPYISTHKTPERHENIRLIRKNTDTVDTLGYDWICPADCGSDWSILWNKSTEICQEENGDSGISVECYYGGFDRYDLDLMK